MFSTGISIGYFHDEANAWGGGWGLGVSTDMLPKNKRTGMQVEGFTLAFTNHCSGKYGCADSAAHHMQVFGVSVFVACGEVNKWLTCVICSLALLLPTPTLIPTRTPTTTSAQFTIDIGWSFIAPDRMNKFVMGLHHKCPGCKCTEKLQKVGDACLALGSSLGRDETWKKITDPAQGGGASCAAFMRDCIGAKPCTAGDQATNKECMEGKKDATSLECQQAKWTCSAPFRKPTTECTPLLKEVGQICKKLSKAERGSKSHKPSCDTYSKNCERKMPSISGSIAVSFGWAWAWVIPTPGSYGWDGAIHTRSIGLSSKVDELKKLSNSTLKGELVAMGLDDKSAEVAVADVKSGRAQKVLAGTARNFKGAVIDIGLTMDAHFCNQRPWGIEAIGCSNNLKLFGFLDRAFCNQKADLAVFPDPRKLRKDQVYVDNCCACGQRDDGFLNPDYCKDPRCPKPSSFLEIMSGTSSRLRGSSQVSSPVLLEESSSAMALAGAATEGVMQDATVRAATQMLLGYLKQGKFERKICIGEKANCDAQDYYKSIYGVATLKSSETSGRSGAQIVASVKKVTLGALAYIGSNTIKRGSGKTVLKIMGPVGRIGMQNVELKLDVFKTTGGEFLSASERWTGRSGAGGSAE